jgi:hypothetical protein
VSAEATSTPRRVRTLGQFVDRERHERESRDAFLRQRAGEPQRECRPPRVSRSTSRSGRRRAVERRTPARERLRRRATDVVERHEDGLRDDASRGRSAPPRRPREDRAVALSAPRSARPRARSAADRGGTRTGRALPPTDRRGRRRRAWPRLGGAHRQHAPALDRASGARPIPERRFPIPDAPSSTSAAGPSTSPSRNASSESSSSSRRRAADSKMHRESSRASCSASRLRRSNPGYPRRTPSARTLTWRPMILGWAPSSPVIDRGGPRSRLHGDRVPRSPSAARTSRRAEGPGSRLASDEAFRRRFMRGSRAAAALDHPNILPVYDAGEADGVSTSPRGSSTDRPGTALGVGGRLTPEAAITIVTRCAARRCGARARTRPRRSRAGGDPARTRGEDGGRIFISDFGITRTSREHAADAHRLVRRFRRLRGSGGDPR